MSRIPKLYTSEETGETHSLKEWEYITGVNASTLSYRIKSMGMTLDEAITAEFNQRNNKFTITDPITGETHSLAEWSDITGIPLNSIYKRYFIYKWPAEKALYGEKHEIINKNSKPKNVNVLDTDNLKQAIMYIDNLGNIIPQQEYEKCFGEVE